jgi:hypothetical protein
LGWVSEENQGKRFFAPTSCQGEQGWGIEVESNFSLLK